jgi:hypothetical protein
MRIKNYGEDAKRLGISPACIHTLAPWPDVEI